MNRAQPPSTLGRYRLVKVLGKGAMGVVYEALDPRLSRTVAIKTILKSHLLDDGTAEEYSRRFETEAQAAARLNHPNIVTVFDFGEQDDVSFIVMEYVRGRELAQAFEAGERFTLAEAVRIMGELLDALAFAHAQHVVHRDVKPANVMLDTGGRVKLTDFGVARVASTHGDRTMPGTMVGTPSYMAPEQIMGQAVGSRADLFAAGVILYQFLTGQRPFAGGGTFAVQRRIVNDPEVAPSRLNAALPALFDGIVARALAKRPDDRYASAQDFAAELRRALGTLPSASVDLDLPVDVDEPTSGGPLLPRQSTTVVPPPSPPPAPLASRPAAPAPLPSGLTTIRPARAPIDDDATLPPPPAPASPPAARAAAPSSSPAPSADTASASTAAARSPAAPSATPPTPPRPAARPGPQPAQGPDLAPDRRRWLAVAGAAGAALLALMLWLKLSSRAPVSAEPAVPATESPAARVASAPVTTSGAAPFSAPPAAPPQAASTATVAPPASAPSLAPTPAPPPAQAQAPASTAAAMAPPPRPPQVRVPAPAVVPSADARKPAPDQTDRRCSELVQRMQLGEALSAEQTATFQRECTRR